MDSQNKKCPLCAETIPIEAAECEYCGAKFSVTITGYCTNCHEMREADAGGRCKVCGTEVADRRVESKFIDEATSSAPLVAPSHVLEPVPPPARKTKMEEQPGPTAARKNKSRIWILGGALGGLVIFAILGGMVWTQRGSLPTISGLVATDTPVPTSTPLPIPTATRMPDPTATSQPEWVTEFADPIISKIRSRNPDFEDSFSDANWSQGQWWKDDGVAFEDSLVRIMADGDYAGAGFGGPPVNAVDFVLEFEFTPRETQKELWIGVSFRSEEDRFNHITISLHRPSDDPWCGFGKNDAEGKPGILVECEDPQVGWGRITKEMIIVKGGRAALYLDGRPMLFSTDLWGEGGGAWIGITSVSGKSVVEFDNIKFWNLTQ